MKKNIPLFDLSRQYTSLISPLEKGIHRVLQTHAFTSGPDTELFEKNFAQFCGTRFALGVGSGTASLIIALKAAGIEKGDEVITTPTTFAATADALVLVDATPVFADVLADTGNLDPVAVEKKITVKTKAILVVHLYGVPCEMTRFVHLAKKHKLILLEDASHAHGSLYKRQPVGSFGLAGCFSLYPSKMIGAIGNAGAIVSNSTRFIRRARIFGNHGVVNMARKYEHAVSGYNELMDNIQAVALNLKLRHFSRWRHRKLQIARRYNAAFQACGHSGMVFVADSTPSLYMYAVQVKDRARFQRFLLKQGIETGVYYPTPLHLQRSFQFLRHRRGDFPVAEKFMKQTVSLPLYPELTEQEIAKIVIAITSFFKAHG